MSFGATTQNTHVRAFVMMYQSKTGIILIIMLMTLLKTSLQNLMQLLTGCSTKEIDPKGNKDGEQTMAKC